MPSPQEPFTAPAAAAAAAAIICNDIFRPESSCRVLDYATSQKLRFQKSTDSVPPASSSSSVAARNPGPYAYNPHLKMLCNDVSFLTQKAEAGDTVIYVGGSIGAYVLLLANMFPTVNFVLYDHNLSNSVKKAKDEGFMPGNLRHTPEVFSEHVAAQLLLQESMHGSKLLLMSDLRNITRNAWGQQGHIAVTDDNVVNDLHLQENWVQVLRPRSAQLKFKLPYHGPSTYSYLKGDVHLQLFGKHSTSEVRLVVDAPLQEGDVYPRFLYNRQDHEDCLHHHNAVTRMQHLDSDSRVRISYDQNAAHNIFAAWKDRVASDAKLSGLADETARQTWMAGRIRELDHAFDRALGLRVSEDLKQYLATGGGLENMQEDDGDKGIMLRALPKVQARRMWKKNMYNSNKTQSRCGGGVWSKRSPAATGGPAEAAATHPPPLMDDMEEGELSI